MRDEGWGSRCVKRFTVAMSAVSARNSSSSRYSAACRGSWSSRTTATATARSRPGSRPTFFVVLSLFSKSFSYLASEGIPAKRIPSPIVSASVSFADGSPRAGCSARARPVRAACRPTTRATSATRAPPRPTASGRGSEAPGCWSDDRPSRSRKSPSHDPRCCSQARSAGTSRCSAPTGGTC